MNILLVDKRISRYEDIVAAIDPTLAVGIVFDYFEDTYDTLKARIRECGIATTNATATATATATSVGLVQHNYRAPTFRMLASLQQCDVAQVEARDPELATWTQFKEFVAWCKTEHGTTHFDMMACALYSNNNWKYVIDTLATQTGITIRASTDNTGSAALGGNWFLESHTGVNLKGVYFTAAIDEYKGLLFLEPYNRNYPTKSFAIGNAIFWPGDITIADVVAVYFTSYAVAILKPNGSVLNTYGNVVVSSGVIAIYSTYETFAALKSDGSVISWYEPGDGSSVSVTSISNSGVVAVYSTTIAFAALKSDGSVVAWGNATYGGVAPSTVTAANSGVVSIYSTGSAFAALKTDGSVVTWGESAYGGTAPSTVTAANSGVVAVYSSGGAFAALKSNGSIVVWGYDLYGGTTGLASSRLTSDVVAAYSVYDTFAALKNDGSIVVWNVYGSDGPSTVTNANSGVVAVYSDQNSIFAALKTTAVTFDLSMSYYTDMDRYDILRKKENRRRANLTTLNNNVFTLSNASDIKLFNPAIPAGKTFSIIVPAYTASSSYSITSTATIPSDAGNFIVACDASEPVTISGTTYVNYGSYVYKRETNNTYTKLTTATIGSGETVFTLYGGDGINSSGIALVNSASSLLAPTLSALTIPASKMYGSAPFAITAPAPTSASGGAITYSSNAPGVATIDEITGVITLVSAGTATFTASQAATAQYAAPTPVTSNELTVSLGTPTLSALTIPASKMYGDVPFAIAAPAPTSASGGAITYSSNAPSVATIDEITGVITLVSAGTATFTASQAATTQYAAPAAVTSNELTVELGIATLSALTIPASKMYGDVPFAIAAPAPTSASGGAITYSSNAPSVATIDEITGVITLVSAGTATFTASQAATSQYSTDTVTSNELTVSLGTPTLSALLVPALKGYGDASFSITAPAPTSASSGAITYSSNNPNIATIDESTGVITIVRPGTVTFTASQAAVPGKYVAAAAVTSNELTVSLVGQIVAPGTSFAGVDLSGVSLAGATLTGVSFAGATLTNANFSGATVAGAVFTNANIVGATNLPAFSTTQKLQLLRNTNNANISAVQISTPLSGAEINAAITAPVPVPDISGGTFVVKAPAYNSSNEKVVTIVTEDITNYESVYIPLNSGETVIVNGTAYTFDGTAVLDSNSSIITTLSVLGVPFRIYVGSIILLNTSLRPPTISAFVVASSITLGDAAFPISARPTSNSGGAMTYTSNRPSVATIDASGSHITPQSVGAVTFTVSQAEVPEKYAAATVTSNVMTVRNVQTRAPAPMNRWFSTNNAPRASNAASDRISALRARTLYRDTVNVAAQGGYKVLSGSGGTVVYSGPVGVQGKCLGEANTTTGTTGTTECVAYYIRSAASYSDLLDVTRGIYAGHSETHLDAAAAASALNTPPANSDWVKFITPQGEPAIVNRLALNTSAAPLLMLSPQHNNNAAYDAAAAAAPDPLKCIQYPPDPQLSITYGGAGCLI